MNPMSIIALLLMLAEHAPTITAEGIKIYADIAHGEGGLGKVQKVVSDLANVVNAASQIPQATQAPAA